MANTWQKFVILRAGKLQGVKGPGLFVIIPVIDNIVAVIDERIQTTAFSAEAALTKDTVAVNVDAIIFWFVHDAQKTALNVTDYREAIDRVAQTSLREMIGSSMLSALLSERVDGEPNFREWHKFCLSRADPVRTFSKFQILFGVSARLRRALLPLAACHPSRAAPRARRVWVPARAGFRTLRREPVWPAWLLPQ